MSVSRLNGSPFDKSGQDADIRNICKLKDFEK